MTLKLAQWDTAHRKPICQVRVYDCCRNSQLDPHSRLSLTHAHTHRHTKKDTHTQRDTLSYCCCLCFLLVNELVPPFVACLESFSVFIDSRPFFPPSTSSLFGVHNIRFSTHISMSMSMSMSISFQWNDHETALTVAKAGQGRPGQSKVGSNLSKFCKLNASNRFAFRIRIEFWFQTLADNGVKSFLIRFVSRETEETFKDIREMLINCYRGPKKVPQGFCKKALFD